MKQYVYSVTITKESDSLAFLKSFDNKIKVNDSIVDDTAVEITNSGTESFNFVAIVEGDTFEEVYSLLKQLSCEYKLSCEYVKDGWVYILPYYQLHSGGGPRRNDRIIHNDVPRRRRQYKHVDLKLRPAEERDYGYVPTEGEEVKLTLEQEITTKRWIEVWATRYKNMCFQYQNYCGCLEPAYANTLFMTSFLLTVNQLLAARGESSDYIFRIGVVISPKPPYSAQFLNYGYLTPSMLWSEVERKVLVGETNMGLGTIVSYLPEPQLTALFNIARPYYEA